MASRIAHISDLHFSAQSADQVEALATSIREKRPDLVVVTGDLTRAGRHEEFEEALEFVNSLGTAVLVVPGNHDIPIPGIWARLTNPFERFYEYFGNRPSHYETPDLVVVGLNTAVGWQAGWDWSLGYIIESRLNDAAQLLRTYRHERLGLVACHHPLHIHPEDTGRSRTFGGPAAFERLSSSGMTLLLHGHLHRSDRRKFPGSSNRGVYEICANTALSNRERSGPAGYNLIDVHERWWRLTVVGWQDGHYIFLSSGHEWS